MTRMADVEARMGCDQSVLAYALHRPGYLPVVRQAYKRQVTDSLRSSPNSLFVLSVENDNPSRLHVYASSFSRAGTSALFTPATTLRSLENGQWQRPDACHAYENIRYASFCRDHDTTAHADFADVVHHAGTQDGRDGSTAAASRRRAQGQWRQAG